MNETTQVEELRHVIQHLRNELKSMTDDLFPVFGHICWIYITDPESEIPIRSCVVSSGKPRQGMVTPNVNVPDKPIRSKIDHIRLSSKKCEVSVTELVLSVKKLQTFIEKILVQQFKNHPEAGADFILILSVGPKLEKV